MFANSLLALCVSMWAWTWTCPNSTFDVLCLDPPAAVVALLSPPPPGSYYMYVDV
jgi:hypothetical protein